MLMPSNIVDDVLNVLRKANTLKGGTEPLSMSAHQILDRLPQRDELIKDRGKPGKGGGVAYSASSVVSDACEMLKSRGLVDITYSDAMGMQFEVAGEWISHGYGPAVSFYRAT